MTRDEIADALEPWAMADHVRRLPAIATCGGCGHRSKVSSLCEHPDARGDEDRSGTITRVSYRVDLSAAPPEWCPRRGGR